MREDDVTRTEYAVPAGRLSVTTTTADGSHLLTVAGEIDHHTGDALREALDLAGTSSPRAVVDMRQVTFMDSTGINLFVAAHHALGDAGGWLRLTHVGEAVMRTFQIVGLDALLDIRALRTRAPGD